MKISKTLITKSGDRAISFDRAGSYVVLLDNVSGIFTFDIVTEGVTLDIFGVYMGKDSKCFDVHTVQHHSAPNSTSSLLIKGVFEDKSKFSYRGLVKIEPNCNGSHAYQKNQNLLLSSQAFVTSEPDLEILSPDVFCTHGSTTGGISKDSIYYMQSRGIKPDDAKQLYMEGFLADIYDKF